MDCGAKLQKLKDLLEILHEIQTVNENQDVEEDANKILEIMKESSKIVQNSVYLGEMIMDAKILQSGTAFCNSNISSLNTNLKPFDEEKYVTGVLNYIQNSFESTPVGNKWQKLAPLTYHLFKKSEPINFMLGSVSLKPLSTQEKKRVERQKKGVPHEKKILDSVAAKKKPEEEENDFCEHLFKWLIRCYKKNDRKPINYFTFIVDPTDFWKTIENMFYFAFLVRDGNVKMFIENGLPYLEPLLRKFERQNTLNSVQLSSQFCFTLNIKDWKKIIKKFKINVPSFPPYTKNKTSNSN